MMGRHVSLRQKVFQDWAANPNSLKSRLVLAFFRLAQALAGRGGITGAVLGKPCVVLYTVVVQWLFGIELPPSTVIGRGLQLFHGVGLVVHPAAILGEDCILRHCTTLGSRGGSGPESNLAPVLGARVDVGCNVVIIGPVSVGHDAVIGAGAVVVNDVPSSTVVGGNPARPLGHWDAGVR